MSSWLAAALAPVTPEEFFSRYWQQSYIYGKGPAQRFEGLLSWSALNVLLARHWRDTDRFRLAFEGRDFSQDSYLEPDARSPRIRARSVTAHLRAGATLSFNGADEVHEPLTKIAESLETEFRGDVQINIYAAWRAAQGLDRHCDGQEVFVLHLDGRKRWLLYGFSKTSASAELDQILTPGDLLYIPKGCYHAAVPLNEPALHVTIGVKPGCYFNRRPSFSFPWSATPEGLPEGSQFNVLLRHRGHLRVIGGSNGEPVDVQCGVRMCRFPAGMQWVIARLDQAAALTLEQLTAACAGQLDGRSVRLLVEMLVKEDFAAISSAS